MLFLSLLTVLVCRYTSYRFRQNKKHGTGAIELLVTPLVTPQLTDLLFNPCRARVGAAHNPSAGLRTLPTAQAPVKENHAQGRQEEEGQGRHGC